MFTIDTKITEKDLKRKNLFKVFHSMNNHQVATPETSLEDARSYVFFAREEKNRMSAFIGLHLLNTDRKLFYTHSGNPFLEEGLQDVEEEARYFAEDMGAMLDEVDFAGLSEQEQDKWIDAQSIFSQKKMPEVAPAEQSPQQVEAAAKTATMQSPASLEQFTPAPGVTRAPERTVTSGQQVTKARRSETQVQKTSLEVPVEAQVEEAKASPLAAAKHRQEMKQNAAAISLDAVPKQTVKKKAFSATGVVSRDREALARLLTSF
jgi:hypothetical protein